MKELVPIIGVIPAMNIGFTEDNQVDIDGLQRHTDYAIRSGIASLMIPVVATEVLELSEDERKRIVDATIEVNNHRIPIIGGASASTKEQCIEYVKQLTKQGCDGVLANIPYENDEQYTDYVKSIAAEHPRFLMIQDYDLAGAGAPEDLLVKLFDEVDCFRCLKIETALPGPKFTRMLNATGGRLHISGGWSITQYIEGLDRGVHGMVPTGMHEIFCKLDSLYRQGHRDKSRTLYEKIQPVIAFSNQHPDISKNFYKRLLWKQGYYKTPKLRVKTIEFDQYFNRISDEMIELVLAVSADVYAGKYN